MNKILPDKMAVVRELRNDLCREIAIVLQSRAGAGFSL
jgi:hypothetical protein